MGLFGKNKKKDNATVNAPSPFPPTPLYNVLSKVIGVAQVRQLAFGDIIAGTSRWDVDMQKGEIYFDDMTFPVLFLGSEAANASTWLWGWTNVNGYADFVWKGTETIYHKLVAEQMTEIKDAEIPLSELVNGHTIASLAVSYSTENMCYYKAPYGGGAAFLLIKSVPESVFTSVSAQRIATCIGNVISSFPINHKLMIEGFLCEYKAVIESDANKVSAKLADGSTLIVSFDNQGRISNVQAK